MATEKDYQSLFDRIAALREQVTSKLAADLISNPQLADVITKQIDDLLANVESSDAKIPPPPDKGLAALAGVGPQAASDFGTTRIPQGVEPYDETITSERIMAVGDMYYLWQHEKIGVFRVVQKMQELFKAGTVRLSGGPGAFALYQFDRRDVLRYTQMPTVRLDLGYLTSPHDAAILEEQRFRDAIADAIVIAVQRLYLPPESDAPTGLLRLAELRAN